MMKNKIARISTVPFFVNTQLSKQISDIKDAGYSVSVVCSNGSLSLGNVDFHPIEIHRKISLVADLVSCYKLYKLFRQQKFNIVHSTTPKAGLLTSIAGFFARTPVRLHTFTGQAWAESTGIKRILLKNLDRLIVKLNSHVYADSPSQMQFLVDQKIAPPNDISCLGKGSLAGVNSNRFNPSQENSLKLKNKYKIDEDVFVFLFLGRQTKDKGIIELISAFKKLHSMNSKFCLLLVGPVEETLVNFINETKAAKQNNLLFFDFSPNPEEFYAVSDVMVLPSYREGFGTTVIEAAAMGVPTIGTNIYGLSDAIEDNKTGMLVEPKNVDDLFKAMQLLLENKAEVKRLGENAKKRACKDYSADYVNGLMIDEYARLLGAQTQ
jgi:glycosyltransferase involved in cell wall biosynthesis